MILRYLPASLEFTKMVTTPKVDQSRSCAALVSSQGQETADWANGSKHDRLARDSSALDKSAESEDRLQNEISTKTRAGQKTKSGQLANTPRGEVGPESVALEKQVR